MRENERVQLNKTFSIHYELFSNCSEINRKRLSGNNNKMFQESQLRKTNLIKTGTCHFTLQLHFVIFPNPTSHNTHFFGFHSIKVITKDMTINPNLHANLSPPLNVIARKSLRIFNDKNVLIFPTYLITVKFGTC